jgi:WD40 repeat protein/transcriptional regulator with XRE-family HTH domain
VKRHVYRERDYAFAQLVLTLRTAIGLTQTGLAERLGASRRAVAEWEGGLSYPKAERLKQLITLGMQQQAFAAGRQEEEIRALWKAAHQKVWLDEAWLHNLLASPRPVQLSPPAGTPAVPAFAEPAAFPRVDLVEALDVSHFTGREVEVAELSQWIVQERCRLVTLIGIGGIGKSTLASYLGICLVPQFEAVLWRSLRDAPPCEELVADCITFFSETPPAEFPTSLEQRITQLLARLQASRCLLVLDNLEALLASGDREGGYLPGYEGYGRLIGRLAESAHQSCVLLTSREKPREIEALEGTRSPVRTLRLVGMGDQAVQELLSDKGLHGTPAAWRRLVASYAGNPLALKIVAQTVSDLFGGDLDRFLQEGELIFNGVRPVLLQQLGRLSPLEHLLLTWLAVLREWTRLDTLLQVLHPRALRAQVLEALEALLRRSLLERGQQASFSLQSVVMEYLTDELSERLAEEIVLGDPQQLRQVALAQAHAKHYVREIQVRLLVLPLLERLRAELGANAQVEAYLLRLLSQFRSEVALTQGYGPANVISLLKALRGHLRGLDLSRLSIRGAYLQGAELQDANLAESLLQECVWTQSFDAITAMAISQSGQYWAAAGRRGEVRVWSKEGKLLHRVWRAHTDRVWALAFSSDGHLLASGSLDGSVKLWDLKSGVPLWARWQTKGITCLAFSPDGGLLATGGHEATVRLWDAKLGTPIQEVPHVGPVSALAWSPDGHLLASDDGAGAIRLWKIPSRGRASCVQTLDGHSSWVQGLAFAPEGRTLASASWDGSVKLWELGEEGRLRAHQTLVEQTQEKMHCVTWSPDGATLASSSFGHTIRLWDAKLGASRVALQGHTADVWGLAFTPDSRHLLSGGDDGTLRLWEVERGQCVRVLRGYDACLYDLDWSPDGTEIASAGIDSVVTIWQVEGLGGGTPRGRLGGHEWSAYGVAWSPDGRRLASSGLDNAIRLWEPATGSGIQVIRDRDHPDTLFWGLAWSPDGTRLASPTYGRGVLVWEVGAGAGRWIGRELPIWIRRVAWSPDGTRLAAGGEDGHVYVWDARGGKLLQRLAGHHGAVISVAWSPDGTHLASGGDSQDSGELFVWDARSGERTSSLQELTGAVYAVAWHPVGKQLITGGSDGRLCWWDLHSGECVRESCLGDRYREAHQGIVQALKVSSDGRRLASCGDDGAIHLWELKSGEHVRTLRRDRPYERLKITGIRGLTQAEIATLRALGAIADAAAESP